jgi:hypothetical protein
VESIPLLIAAWIIGRAVVVVSDWLWLRHCRYIHDQAVERGQNPDPEKMIQAASEGPLHRLGERAKLPTLRKPNNKSPAST